MLSLALLFVGIILGVCAQLSLKYGVDASEVRYMRHASLFSIIKKMFFNRYVFFGFAAYGISLLLWVVVLSTLELSYAYPMVSSGYFFVALFSKILFHERVSRQRWLSIFIIISGVVLIGLS